MNESKNTSKHVIFNRTVKEIRNQFKLFYYEGLLQLKNNTVNTFQIVHPYPYRPYLFDDL